MRASSLCVRASSVRITRIPSRGSRYLTVLYHLRVRLNYHRKSDGALLRKKFN